VWAAVQAKYQPPTDPLNPSVISAKWTLHQDVPDGGHGTKSDSSSGSASSNGSAASGGGGIRHVQRQVVFSLAAVPWAVRRAAGLGKELHVAEGYEWHARRRLLHVHVRNTSAVDVAEVQELATLSPHPQQPDRWTVYESRVEAAGRGWAGARLVSMLPADPARLLDSHIRTIQARLGQRQAEQVRGGAAVAAAKVGGILRGSAATGS